MSNVGSIFTGNVGASGLNRSGNVGRAYFDTYTYSLLFNSLLTGFSEILTTLGATYTRAGTKYNLQNGLYVAYGANAFGTNYDVSEAEYGYYPETAATNIWTYSTDFTNAVWTKGNATVAGNADSPLTGGGSYKLTPSVASGSQVLRHSTLLASGVLSTVSYIVKAAGYKYVSIGPDVGSSSGDNAVFNLETGTITQNGGVYNSNPKIVSVGNGWYRVSVNINSTTASHRQPRFWVLSNTPTFPSKNNNSAFAGDGTSGVLVWNNQAETGGRASSPIITTSSTVTRAADVLSLPTSSIAGFIAAQYSLISHHICTDDLNGTYAASLNDGTGDNRLALTRNGATNDVNVYSGGSTVVSQLMGNGLIKSKLGSSAIINNFLASCNGVAGTADVSAAMPIAPTTLNIGHNLGSNQLNGHLFELALTTYAVTQAQLNTETTL